MAKYLTEYGSRGPVSPVPSAWPTLVSVCSPMSQFAHATTVGPNTSSEITARGPPNACCSSLPASGLVLWPRPVGG